MSSTRITTNHGTISVVDSGGDGPAVLLIHGNSSCKEIFRHQLDAGLAADYRMIALDLPGHGASSDAPSPEDTYQIAGYSACAFEVLDSLGVSAATVLGWSLGGHIAIDMLRQPSRVTGVMISGTPPIANTAEDQAAGFLPSEHMELTGKESFAAEEAEAYARETAGVNAPFESFLLDAATRTDGRSRSMMLAAFGAGKVADQRALVESVDVPLAVVNGADDPFVNNAFISGIAYRHLWEQVHLLAGVGHAPFWEAPEAFNDIFARFLKNVNGG